MQDVSLVPMHSVTNFARAARLNRFGKRRTRQHGFKTTWSIDSSIRLGSNQTQTRSDILTSPEARRTLHDRVSLT
ncbi:MAG: hypothetical protein M3457_19260, partial [Chloroflexota bacterium]|nr:hypothetical protein [Chloroflexota bacterium]